jgi:hypothetical protein
MVDDLPQSGIRLKFVLNKMQEIIGGVLHVLHAERLGEKLFEASHVLVDLDGTETELPMKLEHIVPCAPGTHRLMVSMKSPLSPSNALSRAYNSATLELEVPEDEFVEVHYSLKNIMRPTGGNGVLELAPRA